MLAERERNQLVVIGRKQRNQSQNLNVGETQKVFYKEYLEGTEFLVVFHTCQDRNVQWHNLVSRGKQFKRKVKYHHMNLLLQWGGCRISDSGREELSDLECGEHACWGLCESFRNCWTTGISTLAQPSPGFTVPRKKWFSTGRLSLRTHIFFTYHEVATWIYSKALKKKNTNTCILKSFFFIYIKQGNCPQSCNTIKTAPRHTFGPRPPSW